MDASLPFARLSSSPGVALTVPSMMPQAVAVCLGHGRALGMDHVQSALAALRGDRGTHARVVCVATDARWKPDVLASGYDEASATALPQADILLCCHLPRLEEREVLRWAHTKLAPGGTLAILLHASPVSEAVDTAARGVPTRYPQARQPKRAYSPSHAQRPPSQGGGAPSPHPVLRLLTQPGNGAVFTPPRVLRTEGAYALAAWDRLHDDAAAAAAATQPGTASAGGLRHASASASAGVGV